MVKNSKRPAGVSLREFRESMKSVWFFAICDVRMSGKNQSQRLNTLPKEKLPLWQFTSSFVFFFVDNAVLEITLKSKGKDSQKTSHLAMSKKVKRKKRNNSKSGYFSFSTYSLQPFCPQKRLLRFKLAFLIKEEERKGKINASPTQSLSYSQKRWKCRLNFLQKEK